MTPVECKIFAAAYNDLKTHPDLYSVAKVLGFSHKTIKNKAAKVRKLAETNPAIPKLISRQRVAAVAVTKGEEYSAHDHAKARAVSLAEEVTTLVTSSNYPLINPEAIIVESHLVRRYDRGSLNYELKEGKPRTWLSDTLKVAPVPRSNRKRFIFTSAQNDTEIHPAFWKNLQAYSRDTRAPIVVGPGTYETQWWSENNPTSRSYDSALKDFLCFGQMKIGDNFVFCGESNILPTAASPISDMVTYSRGRWAVFPHAKRQLKSVPSTDPLVQAHQVMTTGSVTKPKVIPRKAGVKSIFHHVLGAVIVEFDKDGDIFPRHISADKDGNFYDLDAYVKNGKVIRGRHRAKVVTTPDSHRAKMGPKNARAIYGIDIRTNKKVASNSLIDVLNPEYITAHDIFDNETRNHHHAKDILHNFEQAWRHRDSVLIEIEEAADFLIAIRRPKTNIKVIEANHDIALDRYITEGRFRGDGVNLDIGNLLERDLIEQRKRIAHARDTYTSAPNFSLLECAMRRLRPGLASGVSWAYDGRSFTIDDIEHGHHGFRGANGAKGTVAGFARMGRKMSIGDKHSPQIEEGVYVAGAMELNHGYNKGPSGWAVTLIVQYPDGKRALITLQNGKWRG